MVPTEAPEIVEPEDVDEPACLSPVEAEQLINPEPSCTELMIVPQKSKHSPFKDLQDPKLMRPGKIDDKGMFARMYSAGFTHEEIAQHFGVSREAVTRMVTRMDLVRETTNPALFQEKMQEEILIRMEAILKYMTPEKMNKASLSQLVITFGTLYDKLRLSRGESTQNIANLNIHAFEGGDLEQIKEVIRRRTQAKLQSVKKQYDKEK